MSADDQKRRAGAAAAEHVRDGMALGLGTGSTAEHFVHALAARVADGLSVTGVPTSEATAALARKLSIPLASLEQAAPLDLTVDGADELDDQLRLIKGGGGALLREKIVAANSRRMLVIADMSKQVETLGAFPLPVEVVRFGAPVTARRIGEAAAGVGCHGDITIRASAGGEPFTTDGGNLIYDCHFGAIADPEALAAALSGIPGVVEHGLFLGLASMAILGTDDGVRILE